MSNITEVTNEVTGEVSVVIDNGDGSFTSMTKAHWEELQARQEAQSL
jgi:hypothetical protein